MENSQNILDQYFHNAQSQDCGMALEDVDTLLSQHVAEQGPAKRMAKQAALLPVKFIILIIAGIVVIIGGATGILLSTGTAVYTGGALVLHHRPAADTLCDTAAVQAWAKAGSTATEGSGTDMLLSGTQPTASPADSLASEEGGKAPDEPTVRAMPWTAPAAQHTRADAASDDGPAAAAEADAVMYREFASSGNDLIAFKSAAGRVEVVGYGGDKVSVAVHLWKQGRVVAAGDPLFARFAEAFAVSIAQDTSTVSIVARKTAGGRMWRGAAPVFTIYTPYRSSCFINNSDCKIDIPAAGTKNITANGGVGLRDLLGLTDTLTSGGGISVKGIRGNMIALSVAGSIDAADIGGNVDACSIGGSIRLSSVRGATDATSMHGSIRADGLTGTVELETLKGDIRASIGRAQGANIWMEGGPVSLPREHFAGSVSDESAQGDINGGGLPVRMSTSGGKMVLVLE